MLVNRLLEQSSVAREVAAETLSEVSTLSLQTSWVKLSLRTISELSFELPVIDRLVNLVFLREILRLSARLYE